MYGESSFKVKGKPRRTTIKPEEPSMILHEVGQSANDTKPARVVAVIVHPRDAEQPVIPEEIN